MQYIIYMIVYNRCTLLVGRERRLAADLVHVAPARRLTPSPPTKSFPTKSPRVELQETPYKHHTDMGIPTL